MSMLGVARTSFMLFIRAADCEMHCITRCRASSSGLAFSSPSLLIALLPAPCAQLRESGVPLEQIQVGRAPDDDETWADLLDAETDDPWMRNPQASGRAPERAVIAPAQCAPLGCPCCLACCLSRANCFWQAVGARHP